MEKYHDVSMGWVDACWAVVAGARADRRPRARVDRGSEEVHHGAVALWIGRAQRGWDSLNLA